MRLVVHGRNKTSIHLMHHRKINRLSRVRAEDLHSGDFGRDIAEYRCDLVSQSSNVGDELQMCR